MEKEFSVVIPVYNEEESLEELFEEIDEFFNRWKKSFEVIFVDDGSTDSTLPILKKLEDNSANVKVFSFRKNLGKSYALMLGFQKAKGKRVATLDADLQDDPKNIKLLYNALREQNVDMVTGWRKHRRDATLKIFSSRVFNAIVSLLFDLPLHDLNSGIKVYKSQVAKDLKLYGGMHRFIPLLVAELGYRVSEKVISHHPRKFGESKYKITKVISDIPDLATAYFLTKYTRRPLHFFGKIGSLLFFSGLVILAYLSILHFMGESIGRRPLLLFGVLLVIFGTQIIFTGLLADLIVNTMVRNGETFPLKYESSK